MLVVSEALGGESDRSGRGWSGAGAEVLLEGTERRKEQWGGSLFLLFSLLLQGEYCPHGQRSDYDYQ